MKFAGLFASCLLATCLLLGALPASAEEAAPKVVVTPVMKSAVTATGQPIQLPQSNAEVQVSTYDIPVGAKLPVHKHPFPRYAYVLSGRIEVTNTEAGTVAVYETGGFIIEAVDQWHKASNIGTEPVKLLVIDMIEAGQNNVVKQ
jgi:quercetin dioxygenase-like cupin family protein